MEGNNKSLICAICEKGFGSVSTKNRHLRTVHKEEVNGRISQHVKCPMCPVEGKDVLGNHDSLIEHLNKEHSVNIKQSHLNFRDMQEFYNWKSQENREVDYTYCRSVKRSNEEYQYFNCNRSNSRGYESNCAKRSMKAGGSIKIIGICPSRICAKISENGVVNVKFIETHVGHEDELRTKRLLKTEQALIVGQLNAGVSNDRILQDARKIQDNQLKRINLITRTDLRYLMRRFNIDKKRHTVDMIATALKIEEWNQKGVNQAFLFKKIGEDHFDLRKEDFAIGFMNGIMERKLKEFKRIICIDGTHGTNIRNFELTTVLVKDEHNMGFPVAFLISNRLDQLIQEIFFRAIKEKLGADITAEYIMSDNDPKYYNAWVKVMACERKPRRLLCTWHVIKNWNIQGRSKLKKQEIRLEMKKDMRKILKETKIENFVVLKQQYLDFLKKEGEIDFVNYLEKYYFQSEERIMMWAHCYRVGVGINTNMAIESLNKVLKYGKMKGHKNIRIEKLLDLLEELVDERMWKRILIEERPNTNNYQSKVTLQAHRKAKEMIALVESMEFGKFTVRSAQGDKFYNVCFDELCDEECRNAYCNECKICIHRYSCECAEYLVKTALCKHIHAVVLYERRGESASGFLDSQENGSEKEEDNSRENLFIEEPTTSKIRYQNDLTHYLKESQEDNKLITFEKRREIELEKFISYAKSLDEESYNKFMNSFRSNMKREGKQIEKKRKIEKQTYYPSKK